MWLLSAAVGLLVLPFLIPVLSDAISLLKILYSRRAGGVDTAAKAIAPQRILFFVAAHNEELLISDCLQALRGLRYQPESYGIVVIADNCDDGTASIARKEGAECLVRHDPTHKGKPHAIAWGLERIRLEEYDAVAIVDADTIVDPDFARQLDLAWPLREIGVQTFNGVSNPDENAITRMAALLSTAYYEFVYPLRERAGLSVPLTGAGMVVGTGVLMKHGWPAFSLSEDLELYTILTGHGVSIRGARRARVYSQEARSLGQGWSQRLRWRGGRLSVLLRHWRGVIGGSGITLHQRIDTLGELVLPGPATQFGLLLPIILTVFLLQPPAVFIVVALASLPVLRWLIYTLLALTRADQPVATLASMLFLPIYTIWRLRAELAALRWIGDRPWIRTRRHAPVNHSSAGTRSD
jgi:cellulose synthase/poly-beta-1,6-N-acetylglucosamine synthase-like glycosyltransferase